jgi:hypothetical protein
MATFICSNGDDFIVQQEDRGYKGVLTEAFKVNGATGVVTVAGQTISSSGVIGSTGAVTATTIAASGLVAAAAAVTVGTTLNVTGLTTLAGGVAITAPATVGGKTIATGSIRSVVAVGRNLAGDIVMAGTVAGDQLVAAVNLTDTPNTDVQADFEATVTVSGHLQQSAAVDLSTKTILFLFHRP